jgi:hypothetical protein
MQAVEFEHVVDRAVIVPCVGAGLEGVFGAFVPSENIACRARPIAGRDLNVEGACKIIGRRPRERLGRRIELELGNGIYNLRLATHASPSSSLKAQSIGQRTGRPEIPTFFDLCGKPTRSFLESAPPGEGGGMFRPFKTFL